METDHNNTPEEELQNKAEGQDQEASSSEDSADESTTINKLSEASGQKSTTNAPPVDLDDTEKNHTHLATIRTYETDSQEVIQRKKTSMADIAIAEQEREEKKPPTESTSKKKPSSFKNSVISALILLLIFGGLGILGYTYYLEPAQDAFERRLVTPQELILTNHKEEVNTKNKEEHQIVDRIERVRTSTMEAGDMKNMYFTKIVDDAGESTKQLLTPEEFVNLFDTHIPSSLVRTFTDQFMTGYHRLNGENEAFFIFPVTSYEEAFAAMLLWEGSMEEDLLPFIGSREHPRQTIATTTSATTTATSTPTTESAAVSSEEFEERDLLDYYTARPFVDKIVSNRDTRVLQLPSGDARLIYAFPQRELLVITTNETTLKEIFDRLSRRRLSE